MAESNEANVDGTIEHESIPTQPTSLSNSGKKDKPPHPARLTAEGKKDSKLNLHSDGSPKSPSPYVGVRDEFTDWVPVFNKVGRGMTPLLDKKDSVLDQTSPTGQKGVIKEFQSPPIPTKKINYGNKDKGSYDDSDDELSPDDDNGTLPTFVLRDSNKPTSGRQNMVEIVNSPRIPPLLSDVPSSPRLIPQSPLIGPGGGKKNTIPPKQAVPASVQAPAPAPVPVFVPEKKQAPAPVQDSEPDSSTSEEEPVVERKPAPKKAAAPPMRRQPSGNRLVPPGAMGAKPKTSANRLSSLASVSKRKQSMDSNYLKNLVGDDTEEEDTLVNSDREVKPKAEELIKELLRDQNMESSLKNFKAAFGDKWKRQALNAILPKTLYYDDEDDRLLVYNLVRRLKKAETLSVQDIETAFTNILEDLLKIIEGSANAPIYLGEILAHGIVDRIIGGGFLNEELAREEIVKLGHSEVVMENMLRVLTNRDLRKRVEENNWNLSAFIKPEDMDLKTKEWLKSRGYGKIY